MSIYHKTCLLILFIASVFAFQCPTNKKCHCELWKYSWDANIMCTMNNNAVFNILIQNNNIIQISCINSSNLSDFNLNMTLLGTYRKITFKYCNLPKYIKLIDLLQKLGVTTKNIEILSFLSAKNFTLKRHHLEDFRNIKELYIMFNNITYFDKNLLTNLKELENLVLIKNSLQHIDVEFFDYAHPQLTRLILEYNNYLKLKPSAFDKLKNLKTLVLKNNHPTDLQLGIFDKLVALRHLDVSSNNLVSLSKDIFAKLKNLNYLYLRNNSLIDLPKDLLQYNTELREVGLSYNQKNLTLLHGFFSNLTNLKSVELNHNGLVTLSEDLFWESSSLEVIRLYNNYFQTLHVNIFRNLTELKILRLNSNNLEGLPDYIFLSTNQLKMLDLSKNRITSISEQLFNGLYSLKILIMEENYIKTISEESFKLLQKLEVLDLFNNYLEVLPNNIFSNNKQLKKLNLSNNRITNISEQLLNGLYSLKILNINNNYLKTISKSSFKSLNKLKFLNLSNNHLEVLPDQIFSNTQRLIILDLSNNRITAISKEFFYGFYSLKELHMERNHLKTVSNFPSLIYMTKINLSNNNLTLQSNNETSSFSPFFACVSLRELYLANNNISKIFHDWINRHRNLYILDLSYNNISSINTKDLQFLSNNTVVNLTHNKIQYISFYDVKYTKEISKTDNNVKIIVKNNLLNCDCDIYDFLRYKEGKIKISFHIESGNSTCYSPKELVKIQIGDLYSESFSCRIRNTDSITVCSEKCDCFLKPYDKTFIFDCSNKNLTSVPSNIIEPDISSIQTLTKSIDSISRFELNFSHNFLMHMPNLGTIKLRNESIKKLILSYNNISEITSNGLSTTMKVLELHNNSISRIHTNVLSSLKNSNLIRLTLHENPWECDCDAAELFNFTQTNSEILSEASKIMCHREKKSIPKMTFYDFCPLDTPMITNTPIATAIATAVAIAFIGLFFGLYYKYQINIKIWLFAHHWCLWFITEEELDKDKLYDAFVSFSHKDNEFIENELVPKLESGPTPFTLCLHYRDWLAGEFIPDNIVKSVENSRRTIVLLSPNFLESVWGRMEFRAAHCQALNEGRARVIIILYGNIKPTDDMDPELKAYISMNTYIKWGDPWFWDKLRYALPRKTTAT